MEAGSAATTAGLDQRVSALPDDQRARLLSLIAEMESGPRRFPLSPAQRGMWFLDRLVGPSSLYSVPWMYRIRGDLDVAALRRALDTIIDRHEALRTRIVADNGVPNQVVEERRTPDWRESDLRDSADWKADLDRITEAAATRPFRLDADPLIRCDVVRLPAGRYAVVFNVHHIVFDAWSTRVFTEELWALYTAYTEDREPDLPQLPAQYGEHARDHAARLEDGTLRRQVDYWTGQLSGEPPVVELPADRPRPAVNTYRGLTVELPLEFGLVERARELARAERGTLFMTLLAAFDVLLHRCTGQTDLTVGVPFAGRTSADVRDLIGLFTTSLPVRVPAGPDMTFREVLRSARQATLGAFGNQDVPIDELVRHLRLDRDLSHNPLFQTLFSVEEDAPPDDVPGLAIEGIDEIFTGTAKFDLTWAVLVEESAARVAVEYNTELFDPATVDVLVGLYRTLLAAVLDDPDLPLRDLPLLSGADRTAIGALNATDRPLPSARPAHELFEERARHAPDAVALTVRGESVTYGELNRRANRLAHHLRERGTGPETTVGVCAPRGIEQMVAVLGVLKSGGVYVPLDPEFPDDRLAAMIEDTAMATLLTPAAWAERFAGRVAGVIAVDDSGATAHQPDGDPEPLAGPDDLAYIIFTSGSTGRPKGVQIPHSALRNFVHYVRDEPGLRHDDALLAVSTAIFDISLYELIAPLTVGAHVVIATEDEARDGAVLLDLIAGHGITVIDATPATWRLLLEVGWSGTPGLRAISTGEALPPDLAAELVPRAAEVWNMYGPTESTVWASHHRVGPDEPRVPIGRPTANTRLYVLDDEQRPLPVGVPGELYIGGDGLARGYLANPALTAERFVPDGIGGGAGARLYRTGDRARLLPTGEVECLGRLDHQFKLRGYRIEPGDIEAALTAEPEVRQAVVSVREVDGAERLVGYVVADGDADPARLRERAGGRLPSYMVPDTIMVLDAVPLSPNGKVDRKALPLPSAERQAATAYVAPRAGLQERLADIWRGVLGVDRVGAYDDFFDLGGHSLDVLKLTAEVENALGLAFSPADLFQYPTVAALADLLGDAPTGSATVREPADELTVLRSAGSGPPLVLMHPVGGTVWCYAPLLDRIAPDRPVYGLSARGLAAGAAPRDRVPEMADAYLGALQAAGIEPPYVLGGWSMGGILAFEMARRLQETGAARPDVLMIDSTSPDVLNAVKFDDCDLLAGFAHDLGAGTGTDLAVDAAELRRLPEAEREPCVFTRIRAAGLVTDEAELDYLRRAASVFAAHTRAMSVYRPASRYGGRVTLLRAAETAPVAGLVPTDGWEREVAGTLRAETIPGDHYTSMRGPLLADTAAAVGRFLTEGRDGR